MKDGGFELHDIVKWAGVAGIIVKEKDEKLYVKFTNHITAEFFRDGKYRDWHKEPSLVLASEGLLKEQAIETYNERHGIGE